jgi:hypothetical protein
MEDAIAEYVLLNIDDWTTGRAYTKTTVYAAIYQFLSEQVILMSSILLITL